MNHTHSLLLASASPRRQELLRLMDIPYVARPSDIDERVKSGESAVRLAGRLSLEKAQAALKNRAPHDPEWILAADTVVYFPDRSETTFGKPTDAKEAAAFLQSFSGKEHEVLTAFCILHANPSMSVHLERAVRSRVRFRKLRSQEIEAYLKTNDWRDKAGGYGIQSEGSFLVECVLGSYTNVIGLPITELYESLRSLEFPLRP